MCCYYFFFYLGLLFQLQDVYCRMYILQDMYLSECIFLQDFAGCIFCRMYILQDIYLQDVYIFLNHLSRSFQKATVKICLMTERGKTDECVCGTVDGECFAAPEKVKNEQQKKI